MALSIVVTIYYTYILLMSYEWFIQPVFKTIDLSFPKLFGIMVFLDVVKMRYTKLSESKEYDIEKPIQLTVSLLFIHLFIWLVKLAVA